MILRETRDDRKKTDIEGSILLQDISYQCFIIELSIDASGGKIRLTGLDNFIEVGHLFDLDFIIKNQRFWITCSCVNKKDSIVGFRTQLISEAIKNNLELALKSL